MSNEIAKKGDIRKSVFDGSLLTVTDVSLTMVQAELKGHWNNLKSEPVRLWYYRAVFERCFPLVKREVKKLPKSSTQKSSFTYHRYKHAYNCMKLLEQDSQFNDENGINDTAFSWSQRIANMLQNAHYYPYVVNAIRSFLAR